MKRIFLFLFAVAVPVLAAGQNPRQAYIDKFSKLAVLEMERTGVPASITLAQALLESGAGQSPLATKANNHFGLKCHNDWDGERFLYDDETRDECFRVYPSAEDSYRAHSDYLLEHDRYKSLFDLEPDDYQGWAKGLRRAGYATDPGYANKLISLIEDYQLYRYDRLAGLPAAFSPVWEDRPETPKVALNRTPARQNPSSGKQNSQETVSFSFSRPVYEQNGVPYVLAVEGETWDSLAAAYGLFPKQLLKYNDLTSPTPLRTGTWVYLSRKKPQAAVGRYLVQREDETLWEISQMFGVQLKKLRLYNVWRGDEPLRPGDTVLLRKL